MTQDLYRTLAKKRYLWETRIRYVLRVTLNGGKPRTVLCFPMTPFVRAVICRMSLSCGCRISTNVIEPADAVIYWDIATRHEQSPELARFRGLWVLNAECIDVSKSRVDEIFAEVFGYDIRLDPLTHSGLCLRKSNENATHDGVILSCPIPDRDPRYVYQKLIDVPAGDGLVEDLRIPVVGHLIPFVYRTHRQAALRFESSAWRVRAYETLEVLTAEEVRLILLFCRRIGLDLGELDVLRDPADGRLYIVDANPTPWGPPADLVWRDHSFALRKMAQAFEEAVLSKSPRYVPVQVEQDEH